MIGRGSLDTEKDPCPNVTDPLNHSLFREDGKIWSGKSMRGF